MPSSDDAVRAELRRRCSEKLRALEACTDDHSCVAAHLGLTLCIAQQVCEDGSQIEPYVARRGRPCPSE